ncbi:MAG: TonB-dependent receptor plug domain-containing protein, partial [Cyanobacteria bacterium P01_H01_bin.15]
MRLFPGLTSCAIASGAILLAVSPSYADELARITDIQLRTLGDGVQLILITDSPKIPDVFQSTVDNTLLVDIVGAQLALPDGNRFQADNPMISVESIVIRQVRDREIQIQIAGDAENLPKVYLDRAPEALLLDVASTVPSAPFDEPSADTGDTLRIIVSADPLPRYEVTRTTIGTRTETDILDIPQNVGEITEDVIDDQGSRTLGEALRNTSGVLTGRAGSGSRATTPIVRGFETDNLLRNGLRDDTLRLSVGLNNIERVEVLKGPTSVLYGPGNLGGTVNLVTKVPEEDPRYDIELLAGNDSRYGASIDLTGPLDDFISYRLTGTYENRDSFQNFENTEFYFIAPTLELIKTEQTSLIFDFEYLNSRTDETAPGVPA